MNTKNILITVGVAAVAFAVAFGLGKATSGSDASTGGTGETAQTFEQSSATITVKAPKGSLPALKPKPTPEPTATPTPAPSVGSTGGQGPVTGGQGPVQGGGQTPVQGGGQTPVTGGGETPVSGGGQGG